VVAEAAQDDDEAPILVPIQPAAAVHVNDIDQHVPPVPEVLQVQNPNAAPDSPLNNDQVLAMDDDTETVSDDSHPLAQLPIPPVEIVDFPDFNNLESLMPEEIQEEDLMGSHDLQNDSDQNNENEQEQEVNQVVHVGQNASAQQVEQGPEDNFIAANNHLQLGFVETFMPPVSPSLLSATFGPSKTIGPNPMSLRFWAKYFSEKDQKHSAVDLPSSWMDFFILQMLGQGSYEWAKEFLTSRAMAILQQHSGNTTSFPFFLPPSKPSAVITELSCSQSDLENSSLTNESPTGDGFEVQPAGDSSPPATPTAPVVPAVQKKGKRGNKTFLCDSDLRRSQRLHGKHKGFKSPVCTEKSCVGCNTKPPVLSSSVVRDLGATFCSIDASKLTDAALLSKPHKEAVNRPCHTRFSKEQNQANHMCAQEVHTYARMKKYHKQCYYITYT
jgi:hypothetical protein